MNIWAFSDLHLSLGNPDKSMEFFAGAWENYVEKIQKGWEKVVGKEDLVLIAGDISWACKLEKALIDLEWIGKLPGRKLMVKGNHDYWWTNKNKIKGSLPSSIEVLQNDSWEEGDIGVAGSRLWDTQEFHFDSIVEKVHNPRAFRREKELNQDEKIFVRELMRLEKSLKSLSFKAKRRIVMTHYPPIGVDLKPSRASSLLEKYEVDICIFGHLHNVKKNRKLFGKKGRVSYFLTSCDFLSFEPLLLL